MIKRFLWSTCGIALVGLWLVLMSGRMQTVTPYAQAREVTLTAATPPAAQTLAAAQTEVAAQVNATLSAEAATFAAQASPNAATIEYLAAQVTAIVGTEVAIVAGNATARAQTSAIYQQVATEQRRASRLDATLTSVAQTANRLHGQTGGGQVALPTPIISESGVALSQFFSGDEVELFYPEDWEARQEDGGAVSIEGEEGSIFMYIFAGVDDTLDNLMDVALRGVERVGGIADFSTRHYFHQQGNAATSIAGRLRRHQFYLAVMMIESDVAVVGIADGLPSNMDFLQEITLSVMASASPSTAAQVYVPNGL